MVNPYKEELDHITWSFSTLHLYEICPYAFYKYKIEKEKGEDNFYAENGKLMHTIFQKMEIGELSADEAPQYYIDEFECITSSIRPSTKENTFNACLDYLCEIESGILDRYEVLWVEHKIAFKIGRRNFTGFIDLLLKDKLTGEMILVDHKSSDPFFKKKAPGEVLKSQRDNFEAYRHQMYLYCKGVYEVYGAFPTKIVWHHFKKRGELSVIDFEQKDYDSTIEWAKKLIRKIYRDNRFSEKRSYIYCHELCGYRSTCEYREGIT